MAGGFRVFELIVTEKICRTWRIIVLKRRTELTVAIIATARLADTADLTSHKAPEGFTGNVVTKRLKPVYTPGSLNAEF